MEMKIQVEDFTAEYAGCGSHEILLTFNMSQESMLIWYDRLDKIIMRRKSVEEEELEKEARIAQEQRARGLIA